MSNFVPTFEIKSLQVRDKWPNPATLQLTSGVPPRQYFQQLSSYFLNFRMVASRRRNKISKWSKYTYLIDEHSIISTAGENHAFFHW